MHFKKDAIYIYILRLYYMVICIYDYIIAKSPLARILAEL